MPLMMMLMSEVAVWWCCCHCCCIAVVYSCLCSVLILILQAVVAMSWNFYSFSLLIVITCYELLLLLSSLQIQLNIVSRFLSDFVAQANLTYKSDTYRSDLQHREDHSQWGKQPKRNRTIFDSGRNKSLCLRLLCWLIWMLMLTWMLLMINLRSESWSTLLTLLISCPV